MSVEAYSFDNISCGFVVSNPVLVIVNNTVNEVSTVIDMVGAFVHGCSVGAAAPDGIFIYGV